MRQHAVAKLGVIISVILFVIGVGLYSFAKLNAADNEKEVSLFSLVPSDCIGLLETDNIEFITNDFTQVAYANQLDTLQGKTILWDLQSRLQTYVADNTHGLSNHVSRVLVSFHSMDYSSRNVIVYFQATDFGKKILRQMFQGVNSGFSPKKEIYRSEEIDIYAAQNKDFIATYEEDGFLVVSYQKRLIEQVIDVCKGSASLEDLLPFSGWETDRKKEFNYVTLYGRTSSVPLLSRNHAHCWGVFDIHLNSEVFYLNGEVYEPDSCIQYVTEELRHISDISTDSLLLVAGQDRVDSCISSVIALPDHSLFEECVSNLSRDASFILVTDMDRVIQHPEAYTDYLPPFIVEHAGLFRSFILSVQVTLVENRLSHIFVFTYKE